MGLKIRDINLSLGEGGYSLVTEYEFALKMWLLNKKRQQNSSDPSMNDLLTKKEYENKKNCLIDLGVLVPSKITKGVYETLGHNDLPDIKSICLIDPFCYLSHLSAMAYHGLTDRISEKIFISSLRTKDWIEESHKQMKMDLKEDYEYFLAEGLPVMTKPKFTKVDKKEVHVQESKFWGEYVNIFYSPMRVSSIGRTFLDMLRFPLLCGGMAHVVDVYHAKAEGYLDLIVEEVERHGKAIDKVRAGYILDEYMDLEDERVDQWVEYAQRGGSRKLDASGEYIPEWSDKWKISLNVF